jgi:hypothetical protein
MSDAAWSRAFILTRDRKNVLVLAVCQTLFGIGRMMIILTAPLIAYFIAEERALATLPHALVIPVPPSRHCRRRCSCAGSDGAGAS